MNQIRIMSIANGPQGTRETLRIMAGLAREARHSLEFCTFVRDLTCEVHTPEEMDDYIRARYTYQHEDIETLYAPRFNVLHYRLHGYFTGDCDDVTILYCAIYNALGYPSRMVAMRTKRNDENYFHVVPELFIHERWLRFDPTVPPGTRHIYFGTMEEYV